jgi:twitching motility protein PilJ
MDQGKPLDLSSLSQSPRRKVDGQQSAGNQQPQPFNASSLTQSPRRQGNDQRVRSQQPNSAGAVLEASLASSNPRRASDQGVAGFKDIPVGQKLALIALSLLLPIGILLYFTTSQVQQDIAFAQKELLGAQYLEPVQELLKDIPQHRGLTNTFLNGNTSVQDRITELRASIEQTFVTIEAFDQQQGEAFGTSAALADLKQSWTTLITELPNYTAPQAFAAHTALMNDKLLPFISLVANNSNLILDPELDTLYLVLLNTRTLPLLTENLGQMRGFGSGLLAKASADTIERQRINTLSVLVQRDTEQAKEELAFVLEANPNLAASLEALGQESFDKATESVNLSTNEIYNPQTLSYDSTQYFDAVTQAITSYFALGDASITVLEQRLQERIQGLQGQNWLTLIGVGVAFLVAFAIIFFITRQITRPLSELGNVSDSLARGDLSQLANIESRDEIGRLAKSFNNAVLQLREANARQEAEIARGKQLQANIGEFLNVAMDIAQGDFTKRGQVSEDALGNVVDAINFMTEELGYLLKDVQNATQSVNQGATEMFGTADTIAQSAQVQAQEAQKAREDVQGIRSTMRQVSDEMNLSAESATQALTASREGRQAVVQTLNGMQDIRREVQAVSKRVKNLGDRSLEISEIVETISRISEQTNLLAVNAAIESSGAGEAGLRFAVVADQVRKLAEESAYAAERVGVLIKTVQDEVQAVITGVEAGTREVEEGYRVASQAGQRLEDISTIVERSAALAQRISQATQEQVSRVEQVGQVVEQMAEISEKSQGTVSQGREAAERLRQLATQLSENLSRFRLA